ncbi:MAG: ATP-dependent DNA ligase [Candidatus Helarchaeota archaeon]|nr:ATP-dependent DNA ligase [Candidatus Helarchaeota archaeon]
MKNKSMRFSELANYFERLEQISSRLALIEILAELFKNTNARDIDKIIYLSQGRVAPFFAPIEIGMADKTVAGAVALAFGFTKEAVISENAKKGDLGLVAQQLRSKIKDQKSKISVENVFNTLLEIAKISGGGTVEKRVGLFSELLKALDPISAKHLVRMALGRTRLGIGDPTILDALALALLGDRANRKLLERAYNETSDLGLIGKTLLEGGLEAIKKLSVTVGRPIRSELCERLPNPEKVFEKMEAPVGASLRGVHVTFKYDGFRVQIHKNGDKVSMFSRNLEDMTHMFPELIKGTLEQVKAKTAILDSEAMAYQPESEEYLPFQETTKRRRKYKIEEMSKSLPLRAFVFDILYADGKSLLETPLVERMEKLKKVIEKDDTLIASTGEILKSPKDLQLMLDDAISKGLEGVVVKRVDSKYEAGGRNFNWVKLKRHSAGELQDTIDCVILGYVYGRGKRTAFGAGALLVGVYDSEKDEFVTVSKIGTGLTDEEWRSIKSRTKNLERKNKPARVSSSIVPSVWVEPEIVIEVLADEITRSPIHTAGAVLDNGVKIPGYALRFPRLVSFRDKDKKAEDATSVKELIEMSQQQGKK